MEDKKTKNILTDARWATLKKRFLKSEYKARFKLADSDIEYINDRGINTIKNHANDFVIKRLVAENPKNDGRQTPMKGHPVFVAQHATGTCCRQCLKKWHRIATGKKLTDDQVAYIVDVIMRWLTDNM